ncbi:MAG: YopX family protein [Balneola sp.]
MNRKIKFRGKRIDGSGWVYGYLISIRSISNGIEHFEVDPETVGQFTGLIDKYGKEIYGGGYIKAYHQEFERFYVGKVIFKNGTFQISDDEENPIRYWKDGIHDWHSMEQYTSMDLEIIEKD